MKVRANNDSSDSTNKSKLTDTESRLSDMSGIDSKLNTS